MMTMAKVPYKSNVNKETNSLSFHFHGYGDIPYYPFLFVQNKQTPTFSMKLLGHRSEMRQPLTVQWDTRKN